MTKYKVRNGIIFDGVQWREDSSFPGCNKYCQNWLIKTMFGMLRVNLGNYVLKGPGDFKIVLDPSTFNAIFEKDE